MKQSLNNWQDRKASPSYWIAVFFGSGLIRPAPGTWGSFAALIAGYLIIAAGVSAFVFSAAILLITIVGTLSIDAIERQTGVHDAPEIVIDEVAGMWLALLPCYYMNTTYALFIVAFVLFRLFDIIKPWPIGWLDRKVRGGFGVMVDDIVAGIFAILGIEILAMFGFL